MAKYLELPWSVEDTIENLKKLRQVLQQQVIAENLHGQGEEDAIEIAFDFDRAIKATRKADSEETYYRALESRTMS